MTPTPFKFPTELLSQDIAILGRKGSGKTYAGKGIVERLLTDKRRVCILDPTGVWWGLRSSADGKKAGFPIVVFGGMHADVRIAEGSGKALAKIVAEKNLPSIIDMSEMLIGGRHRFVTDFSEELYRLNRAPLHLVIDEADEFAPQNPMPETKRMLHHIDRIVRRGRVRGFRVTLITQRPAVLHKNVLTQANTLVAMRLTAPQDRDAVNAWVEGQADKILAKEVLGTLASLKRGEGWVWAPEIGLLERQTFPKITTFDSSRTPDDDEVLAEPTKLAAVDLVEIKASFIETDLEAKTIAELKAELAKFRKLAGSASPAASAARGVPEAEVERRIARGIEAAMKVLPPGKPDVKLAKALEHVLRIASAALSETGVELTKATAGATLPPLRKTEPRAASTTPAPRETASISGIRAGAVRILQELAARAPAGYTLAQVGGLTQFSVKGGTFRTYMGDLRRAGLILERDGMVFASEQGVTSLGDRVPDAPTTHDAAMDLWRRALRKGAHQMLEVVVAGGPDGISTDELASAVDMEPSGGTFRTYLGDLRRNGLIATRDGRAVANDILWPERA